MAHSTRMKHPGDPIELGDTIGFAIEPDMRYGRLVGIRKDDCREIERYIIRKYQDSDGDWPTGEYVTTSHPFVIAWEPPRVSTDVLEGEIVRQSRQDGVG